MKRFIFLCLPYCRTKITCKTFLYQECTYKVTERAVQIVLRKLPLQNDDTLSLDDNENWWPRLTLKSTKFPWLKIDFDRWKDPHESQDEEKEKEKDIFKDFDMAAYEVN